MGDQVAVYNDMAMARGNKNWGKPGSLPVEPSSFDMMVEKLGLADEDLVQSTQLREWAVRNADSKYVPERLLRAWQITSRPD